MDEPAMEEQPPRALHHRLYPYMDELVQYATERADDIADPDAKPWIVRDRSTALRNERQGRGRALFRTWIPTDWQPVNVDDEHDEHEHEHSWDTHGICGHCGGRR